MISHRAGQWTMITSLKKEYCRWYSQEVPGTAR